MKHLKKSFFLMLFFFVSILFISCDSPSNPQSETENSSTYSTPTSPANPENPTQPSSPQTPSSPETPVVTYTVSFVTEHGTLPDSIKNGISVKENTLLSADILPSLFADGYAFGGWYDGETLVVANEYKITKNVTLTAKWTVATVSYTVSFVSSHGTTPQAITLPENTVLLEDNAPTLSEQGYRFDGWFDGENKIEVGSYILEKDLELTAKWTAGCIIHFVANGGTGTMADQIFIPDGTSVKYSKNLFTREGYVFDGWGLSDYGLRAYGDEYIIQYTPTELVSPIEWCTLYACWKPITYIIRFDSNYGKTEEIECTYGEQHSYNYQDTDISNSGLYIKNWNTKPDGSGLAYVTTNGLLWRNFNIGDISTENGSINTLYAQWESSTYYVVLQNGGLNDFQPQTENGEKEVCMTCKCGTTYILSNPFENPPRYYINYWRDENNNHYETNATFSNLTKVHGSSVRLYPVWDSTSYRIHFDGNGGYGRDMYEIYGYYDEEVTMPENIYTRSGYKFICWEGGYPVGSKAKNLTEIGGVVTVKAIWAKVSGGENLTISAPAKNAATIISLLPNNSNYTLKLSGECNEETIIQIASELKNKTITLELHLEDTTGLTYFSGYSECSCLKNLYLSTGTKISANALYGCSNLEGVYYPYYNTNSSAHVFLAEGSNTQGLLIRLTQYANGQSEIDSTFMIGETFSNSLDSNHILASILTNNGLDRIKKFEGYKFEWEVNENRMLWE